MALIAILDFQSEQFCLYLIYNSPRCFLPSFESIGLLVQEKKRKIDFHDGSHLGFMIRTILTIFDLQVTAMLQPSFKSIGFSVRKKKRKTDFEDGRHLGFPIGTILAIFDQQVTQMLPTKFRVNWPFC